MKLKAIKRVVVDIVPVGSYLTSFETIWGNHCNPGSHEDCLEHGCMDNEPSYIAEIEPISTLITEDNYRELPHDVTNPKLIGVEPLFEGDTHDLRPRIFATLEEAQAHLNDTVKRFNNAQPWEVFVKTA